MSGSEHSDEWIKAIALPPLDDDTQHEDHRSDGATPHFSNSRYPHDFLPDEESFAETFRNLLAPENDAAPPDLAQTLLGDERNAPTPPGYEQKITYQVMRRLNLPRRPLFEATQTPTSRLMAIAHAPRRPLAGVFTLIAMLMIGVVVLSGPAFAAGLEMLAGHTGVQQTATYPSNVRSIISNTMTQRMSLLNLQTTPYWLGSEDQAFTFESVQLYGKVFWSSGPIVDFQYENDHALGGLETLDIREFQLSSKYAAVLQVVQQGSATLTQVGNTPAVFVNGGWAPHHFQGATPTATPGKAGDQVGYVWQSGTRSELMFEQNDVVFWMTLNVEANAQTLIQLALGLTPLDAQTMQAKRRWLTLIGFTIDAQMRPYAEAQEVYEPILAGASANSGGVGAFVTIN